MSGGGGGGGGGGGRRGPKAVKSTDSRGESMTAGPKEATHHSSACWAPGCCIERRTFSAAEASLTTPDSGFWKRDDDGEAVDCCQHMSGC